MADKEYEVIVKRHFVDTRKLISGGPKTVDLKTATRWVNNGHALWKGDPPAEFVKAQKAAAVAADGAVPLVNPRLKAEKPTEGAPVNPDSLPDDFPEVEKLRDAGFLTFSSLKKKGSKEKIAAIDGIDTATLNKIGMAAEGK